MSAMNPIETHLSELDVKEKDLKDVRNVLREVSYHARKIKDLTEDGEIEEVTDWSGTRFRATTKDGHDIWYTISDTDITDATELNKLILTIRKYAGDLTLAQARRKINGKTFAANETLGEGQNFVRLLQLDGRFGLRPIVTPSSRHTDHPMGFGSTLKKNGNGFYGVNLGRLVPGRNGLFARAVVSIANGYSRGNAGQFIGMLNPKLKEWNMDFTIGSSLLAEMDKAAEAVEKYGDADKLWRAVDSMHRTNTTRESSRTAALDSGLLASSTAELKSELVERQRSLTAKEEKLKRVRMWGTVISDGLKDDIKELKSDINLLHTEIIFRRYDALSMPGAQLDTEEKRKLAQIRAGLPDDVVQQQLRAVGIAGALRALRQQVRDQIAVERLRPVDEQDTGAMGRQEQRLQRAIDQIEAIMRFRVLIINEPEVRGNRLATLRQAQEVIFALGNENDVRVIDDTLDTNANRVDLARAVLFDISDEQVKALEAGNYLESLASKLGYSLEELNKTTDPAQIGAGEIHVTDRDVGKAQPHQIPTLDGFNSAMKEGLTTALGHKRRYLVEQIRLGRDVDWLRLDVAIMERQLEILSDREKGIDPAIINGRWQIIRAIGNNADQISADELKLLFRFDNLERRLSGLIEKAEEQEELFEVHQANMDALRAWSESGDIDTALQNIAPMEHKSDILADRAAGINPAIIDGRWEIFRILANRDNQLSQDAAELLRTFDKFEHRLGILIKRADDSDELLAVHQKVISAVRALNHSGDVAAATATLANLVKETNEL